MVKRVVDDSHLDRDAIFHALAQPIRRDIIEQLADGSQSVSELGDPHDVTLAAVSKHLRVLEDASLTRSSKTAGYADAIWTQRRYRRRSGG